MPFLLNGFDDSVIIFPSLCHLACLAETPPFFFVPTGPVLRFFAVWNINTEPQASARLLWPDFVQLLTTATPLKMLSINISEMDHIPSLESLSSTRIGILRNLTELQVKVTSVGLLAVFGAFDFPSLEWLQVIYETIDDAEIKEELGKKVSLPLLKRLTWYTHATSTVPVFRIVDAPQLETLDVAAYAPPTVQSIFKQIAFINIPQKVQIRCFGPRSGYAVLRAAADLGAIKCLSFSTFHGAEGLFEDLEEPIELPNVTGLSFYTYSWDDIEDFLNRLTTPLLTRIERYSESWEDPPSATHAVVAPLLDNGDSLLTRIREIEIRAPSASSADRSLVNLEKLTIIVEPSDKLSTTEGIDFILLYVLGLGYSSGSPNMPSLRTLVVKFPGGLDDTRLMEIEEILIEVYQIRRGEGVPLTQVITDARGGRRVLISVSDGMPEFVDERSEEV